MMISLYINQFRTQHPYHRQQLAHHHQVLVLMQKRRNHRQPQHQQQSRQMESIKSQITSNFPHFQSMYRQRIYHYI